LERHVYGTELKNQVERMNQGLKDSREWFDDLFRIHGPKLSI
jgi:hypothetical protein